MTEKLTLTVQEVADLTGLGRDVVLGAIVRGELPAKLVGPSGRYRRILRKDLDPWLDSLPEA
jgi:excisionase family DNA binding protein